MCATCAWVEKEMDRCGVPGLPPSSGEHPKASPPAPCFSFPSQNYASSDIQQFSNSVKKHTELSREEKYLHIELPCRRTRNGFSPCVLSQHPSPAQGGLCPTGLCLNGLYRDMLWTEGIRCAGAEQFAFFKAVKAWTERPDGHHRAPKRSKKLNEQLGTSHTPGTACRASRSRSSFCAVPVLSPSLLETAQLRGNYGLRLTGDAKAMVKSNTRYSASEKCN